jgi:hypothetical protein
MDSQPPRWVLLKKSEAKWTVLTDSTELSEQFLAANSVEKSVALELINELNSKKKSQ